MTAAVLNNDVKTRLQRKLLCPCPISRKTDTLNLNTLSHSHSHDYSVKTNFKYKGLMVDTGATSHIITKDILQNCDETFDPNNHYMELADGSRKNNLVQKVGDAEVILRDDTGRPVKAILKGALYIPSYPHDIFSVKAATKNGAEITLRHADNKMVKEGATFTITEYNRLFYLETLEEDQVNLSLDVNHWHRILGHCNFNDVYKLENVVKGMEITGKVNKVNKTQQCSTCIEGKSVNSRNRNPDAKANHALELVHTDLVGPMNVKAKDDFKYAITFTDNFSGTIFVYFLRYKSDTVQATEQFLADAAPYGNIKCIRSDNGGEFISSEFKLLLRKKGIRHKTSSPYSPHQNGTAERQWRTLFDMARCLLVESGLPKNLWTYAFRMATYIRNRCFNNRTGQTPFETLTGNKPDLSNMWIFGSECYAYKHNHGKLDSRCEKGVFVGHDTNSPAYLVYYPSTGRVIKHRLVTFLENKDVGLSQNVYTQTNSDLIHLDQDSDEASSNHGNTSESDRDMGTPSNEIGNNSCENNHELVENRINDMNEGQSRQTLDLNDSDSPGHQTGNPYPQRERNPPKYLEDYVTDMGDDSTIDDSTCSSVDYYYKTCGDPQNFQEALNSPLSPNWKQAMRDELDSLKENDTFELVRLPEGKSAVGGKWVYCTKENADGQKSFKARYVAKGYNQIKGIDYTKTFSPTANITSMRALMQIAAHNNLTVYQMDVKTAFLHAPIDTEIYLEQPEGFEVKSNDGEKLVYRLKKSIYGLKQSGRNWNRVLHDHLCNDGFVENSVDHCVYKKTTNDGVTLVIIWVDDLIIAASNMNLMNSFKDNMKRRLKMKDLGKISYFLGIDFNQKDGEMRMNQKRYLTKLLERFNMTDCKPRTTPCEVQFDDNAHNNEPCINPTKYRELVGSLIYAATSTRPDISFVVSKLSQHLSTPLNRHMLMGKHVLRYLKGTLNYELVYRRSDEP